MRRPSSTLLAIALCGGVVAPLLSQGIRVTGTTGIEYVQARPLYMDSIAIGEALGSGLLRRTPDGDVVRCVSGAAYCWYLRSGGREHALPAVQDIAFSGWGLGQGLRIYGRMRGRAVLGETGIWPRGDQHFDLVAAFVELDRSRVRVRVGRQWRASALGYRNFDGAAVLARPLTGLQLEAFGGWSLVQNLHAPVTSDEVAVIEPLAPDTRPILFGLHAAYRPSPNASFAAVYQREIRPDQIALYSERLAATGTARLGGFTLEGDLAIDFGMGVVTEGRVQTWAPPWHGVETSAYVRHHRPFFELWTIWGAFSPVGFDELGLVAEYRHVGVPASFRVRGALRQYEDTDVTSLFGDVRNDSWRLGAGASLAGGAHWYAVADYVLESGFGATRSDLGARIEYRPGAAVTVGINAGLFQQLAELRTDERTVLWLGVDAGFDLGRTSRLIGGAHVYHHDFSNTGTPDWTQLRGSLRYEWALGTPTTTTGAVP